MWPKRTKYYSVKKVCSFFEYCISCIKWFCLPMFKPELWHRRAKQKELNYRSNDFNIGWQIHLMVDAPSMCKEGTSFFTQLWDFGVLSPGEMKFAGLATPRAPSIVLWGLASLSNEIRPKSQIWQNVTVSQNPKKRLPLN